MTGEMSRVALVSGSIVHGRRGNLNAGEEEDKGKVFFSLRVGEVCGR